MLTPDDLAAAQTEHAFQSAFFAAATLAEYWEDKSEEMHQLLQMIYAIPSGGARDVVTAGRLKAEGVKAGVPDTHFPVARRGYHSLYMEFKKPERMRSKNGGLSDAQVKFKALLEREGHCVVPVYGWRHAVEVVNWYLRK